MRRGRIAGAVLAGLLVVAGCSDDGDDGADAPEADGGDVATDDGTLVIETVSTRPEHVTGGDVLVRISGVAELDGDLAVTAGGDDVTEAFGAPEDGAVTGLVTGLSEGSSTIEAAVGDATASLDVVVHPTSGPVFSGPHLEPFACTTEDNGLGAATDEDCSAPTVVRWSYVDGAGELVALDDPANPPADVETTEIDGREVPMIVRTESGTINRGIYWIHVLDPSPADERWDPSAWNGTLVYRFGGGCGTTFSQGGGLGLSGGAAGPGAEVAMLRAGYAQATNTFNTFQTMCNDVLSAESLMMTRERFIEAFAEPAHVVGEGGSGGAIQQYLIAQSYPGLLDAVVAAVPFPDHLSIAPGVTDCGLLQAFYATPAGSSFTPEQRQAVNGHGSPDTCGSWASTFLATIDPTTGCSLPDDQVYDPATNPDGARCTLTDSNVNLLGEDPDTGIAARPLDNVGVQYGLDALNAGTISVDQFLDLNDAAGGYDIDGQIVGERHQAAEEDVERIHSTGRVNSGGGDLQQIPVFTLDVYTDPTGDIHDRSRAFTVLERSRLDDGTRSPNHVLWTVPGGEDLLASLLGSAGGDTRVEMLRLAVEWLDALDVPAGDRSHEDIEAARPAGAVDVCLTPDGVRHEGGDELYEPGTPCTEAYPVHGDPRTAAGMDLGDLVGRCQLTDVDAAAYDVAFSEPQLQRLREIFPDGVCDWTQPGVGEVELAGTWLDYSDGPPR